MRTTRFNLCHFVWVLTALLSASDNVDLRFTYSRLLHSFEFASDGIVLAVNIRRI